MGLSTMHMANVWCDGGKRDLNDLLSYSHYPLQGLMIREGTIRRPGSDPTAQDAFDGESDLKVFILQFEGVVKMLIYSVCDWVPVSAISSQL